ncbi:MAG: flavin reductase family protein [Gemmatimonadetes bacterium]|nr:flavin reductase family protein [Gemmatimonadota bacterium]
MDRPPVDATTFRRVLGSFASGVTVVAVRGDDGADHGMTVSAFCSVSLEPPLVLVCIDHAATCAPRIAAATHAGISILGGEQAALSRRFADPAADRFDGVAVVRGVTGVPLLDGALAHLECRLVARYEAGDHAIVVGEVVAATATGDDPLVYFRGQYRAVHPTGDSLR